MDLKELKEKVKEFKKVAQEKQAATEQALFERLFEFFGGVYAEREGLLNIGLDLKTVEGLSPLFETAVERCREAAVSLVKSVDFLTYTGGQAQETVPNS